LALFYSPKGSVSLIRRYAFSGVTKPKVHLASAKTVRQRQLVFLAIFNPSAYVRNQLVQLTNRVLTLAFRADIGRANQVVVKLFSFLFILIKEKSYRSNDTRLTESSVSRFISVKPFNSFAMLVVRLQDCFVVVER
jgi:hypothetical protein